MAIILNLSSPLSQLRWLHLARFLMQDRTRLCKYKRKRQTSTLIAQTFAQLGTLKTRHTHREGEWLFRKPGPHGTGLINGNTQHVPSFCPLFKVKAI